MKEQGISFSRHLYQAGTPGPDKCLEVAASSSEIFHVKVSIWCLRSAFFLFFWCGHFRSVCACLCVTEGDREGERKSLCVCVVWVGDIFQSPLCCLLIVLGSCLPLCTINSIICTWPSQPSSPWATVFPSGVSALHAACQTPLAPTSSSPCCLLLLSLPSVGTGLARPRWDPLTFGHHPLQEVERWLGTALASQAAANC